MSRARRSVDAALEAARGSLPRDVLDQIERAVAAFELHCVREARVAYDAGRSAERLACLSVAENHALPPEHVDPEGYTRGIDDTARKIAKAIRARGGS